MSGSLAHRIWFEGSIAAKVARIALYPSSLLYAGAWQTYLGLYQLGLKKPSHPHSPILCVGNLVTGGSGKSPVALHLCDVLRGMGRKPVLSCSGYGSSRQEGATLAPEGDLDPAVWGDEPAMVRWLAPDLPLIVGRNRVSAARICHQDHGGSVLILDDGFQHLPLQKDISVVLDELLVPNPFCLPAGPYREPKRNRQRADLILPDVFSVRRGLTQISDALHDAPVLLNGGVEVTTLCAIGRPDVFEADLRRIGLRPTRNVWLRDHDPMGAGNLLENIPKGNPVVVTAKDWVKLRRREDLGGWIWWVATTDVTIDPDQAFVKWLKKRLDELESQ